MTDTDTHPASSALASLTKPSQHLVDRHAVYGEANRRGKTIEGVLKSTITEKQRELARGMSACVSERDAQISNLSVTHADKVSALKRTMELEIRAETSRIKSKFDDLLEVLKQEYEADKEAAHRPVNQAAIAATDDLAKAVTEAQAVSDASMKELEEWQVQALAEVEARARAEKVRFTPPLSVDDEANALVASVRSKIPLSSNEAEVLVAAVRSKKSGSKKAKKTTSAEVEEK